MPPRSRRSARWTYRRSGVDRGAVATALAALLSEVRYRAPASSGKLLDLPGHYAGIVQLGRERIAVTTDTVGTKVLLAQQLGRYVEVGEDLVAVNVNDLAAIGARPAALVDVISCRRPDPSVFRAIGRGIDRGLRRARCALLGGETAVVPDLVHGLDLGGTAIGFFPGDRRPVTGERLRPGDLLLGLSSSGFHANGYTLVRRLIERSPRALGRPRGGDGRSTLADELLRPTRCYVPAAEAVASLRGVHGLAHISGGGVRNLPRLNPDVRFVLDRWPEPEGLFAWAQALGRLSDRELYQTFNAGIGFVVAVARGDAPAVRRALGRAGFSDAREVGEIERGRGVSLPRAGLEYSSYS